MSQEQRLEGVSSRASVCFHFLQSAEGNLCLLKLTVKLSLNSVCVLCSESFTSLKFIETERWLVLLLLVNGMENQ